MASIIRTADSLSDFQTIRELFREYANGLGIDLDFQGFDAELAGLPGKYAPPMGRLLLAWKDEQAVGCIAMRPFNDDTAEMKRLYVRSESRGEQLGRRLVEHICSEARIAGYSKIWLDTLPTMASAQRLYESLGFVAIKPYTYNPVVGTKYFGLDL
jgi:ribosomal protein S18 acetylase RimI-like enzyme